MSPLDDALDRFGEELRHRPRRGSFSESFLEEIRRTNMPSVVERYVQMPQRLSRMVNCPFHNDSNPSMRVYDDHAYCFGCHWHGDQIKFVMQIERLDFRQAVIRVAEICGLPLEFASAEERQRLAERRREYEECKRILEVIRGFYGMLFPCIMRKADELKRMLPDPYSTELLASMADLETRQVVLQYGHKGRPPAWMETLDPLDRQFADYCFFKRSFRRLMELIEQGDRLVELDGRKEDGSLGGVPINHIPPPSKSIYYIAYDIDYGDVPPWLVDVDDERERWAKHHCVENWVTEDDEIFDLGQRGPSVDVEQLKIEQMLSEENWITEDDDVLDVGPRDFDEADRVLCRSTTRS